MEAFHHYLNNLISRNKELYSTYPEIKWLNAYDAIEAEEKRKQLLDWNKNSWLFKNTKPFYNKISDGCRLCGQGLWSCLFITGKCNANCFYCPTSQLKDDLPTSQQLTFETPEAFAEYVNYFGFKGVSFSGGEPLLYFDRTLSYLNAVRKYCSPDIYIWMYTNGILADKLKLKKLAESGLNEIRFDIGATGYKLDKIRLAKDIIPNITIEIPSVPEKKEHIIALLPKMIDVGVTNLNLHQLRLTPYNANKLTKHQYTYIAAEHPIVLESELAALEIMKFANQNQLGIGINYCSFYFKYRFQKAGYRKQITSKIVDNNLPVTEKGYVRSVENDKIEYQGIFLNDTSINNNQPDLKLKNKSFAIKRGTAYKSNQLSVTDIKTIKKLTESEPKEIPNNLLEFNVWNHEYIESDLRQY